MSKSKNIGRRDFLRQGAAAAVGAAGLPYILSSSALGADGGVAASERIGLGFIGLGSRGTDHLKMFVPMKEAQVLAVCDVDRGRCEAAKRRVEEGYARVGSTPASRGTPRAGSKVCDTYNDFREMLARGDIDAVVIATPEHWHGLTMIAAAKAQKDIYGEKALTLTVGEGRVLCDTVRKFRRVFQVGTQQRSDKNFRHACELAQNDYLGKVHTVTVGVPGGHKVPNSPTIPVPKGFDYDMWLGPAPEAPYNALRCTSPEGWYHIYDYCAGWIQSWGVHHIDVALWGAPGLAESQLEVDGTAVFSTEGQSNTSLTWRVNFVTPGGLKLRFSDDVFYKHGCHFEGDKGWVHVTREGIWAEPKSLLDVKIKPNEIHLYESKDHHTNFLECVRSRREPAAPVEAGHTATTATLVADIATRIGRKIVWDWKSEQFVNDEEANKMLKRTMRSPWRL